jgi:2-amino-4-hydroxy-6-hydroxymethyldihydropteridine diphosphokinase
MRAFVGLGSNLGDGPGMVRAAVAEMDRHDSIHVVRVSSLYRSAAWGRADQPDFTNAVAELETGLSPQDLLAVLLDTELHLGRERNSVRWSPRIIDIDLLCCGQYVSRRPDLELPHPRMHLRAFVLVPLLELDPDLVIPGIGSVRSCLDRLETQDIQRLEN